MSAGRSGWAGLIDGQMIVPAASVGLILVMILPLPGLILDVLISINIAFSLVTLLTSVSISGPLHFSVLPSLLLIATVARLGLNIASTRRILLHGAEGTDAAGSVIEAFGNFVVGGNMVVGAVVFLVLLAVQFIVINHGANRISEVSARFTLDAMPGKQMAIDADLNAGLINDAEAKERRERIQQEADFYGAMDGAVKFTQRDAIASLVIVSINILAGLAIGIGQNGLSPFEAIRAYTILTVGDGLVSAIPALLISIAGALITTRSGTDAGLSADISAQLLSDPMTLGIASGSLLTLGLIPGLPTVAFGLLATATGAIAYAIRRKQQQPAAPVEAETPKLPPEEPVEPLITIDPLTVEVGYDLIAMAGSEADGGLLDRIRRLRRQVALDLGVVVPPVRIRDNLNLGADEYRILLRGAEIGRSLLRRGKSLAIDPGDVLEALPGEATRDPSFGIPALWIDDALTEKARSVGYTIVDPTSVLATHLSELIRTHAPELLGRQEVQRLIDNLSKSSPKLVEELIPEHFTVGQIQRVLRALVSERVSIRDMESILEALADAAGQQTTLDALVAHVRRSLSRSIVQPLLDDGHSLPVLTLSPEFDRDVRGVVAPQAEGAAGLTDPRLAQGFVQRIADAVAGVPTQSQPAVLCSDPQLRLYLRKLTSRALPAVPFLSVQELPDGVPVNAVGKVN